MMMRALFWIAVVAVMMPHEPDLGLGRPGAQSAALPQALMARAESLFSGAQAACQGNAINCMSTAAVAAQLPAVNGRTLDDVRAEIEQAIQERKAHRHAG